MAVNTTKATRLTLLCTIGICHVWGTLTAGTGLEVVWHPGGANWSTKSHISINHIATTAFRTFNFVAGSIIEARRAISRTWITLLSRLVNNFSNRARLALPCFEVKIVQRVRAVRSTVLFSEVHNHWAWFARFAFNLIWNNFARWTILWTSDACLTREILVLIWTASLTFKWSVVNYSVSPA